MEGKFVTYYMNRKPLDVGLGIKRVYCIPGILYEAAKGCTNPRVHNWITNTLVSHTVPMSFGLSGGFKPSQHLRSSNLFSPVMMIN